MSAGASAKTLRVDVFVLALLAATLVWQLPIEPVIGIADAGDFPRIMGPFAITYASNQVDDEFFNYAL